MIYLTDEQFEFLKKEFRITADDIEVMDKEQWRTIRKNCYNIVIDEMLDENGEYNPAGDNSERCWRASEIMDISFKKLFEKVIN